MSGIREFSQSAACAIALTAGVVCSVCSIARGQDVKYARTPWHLVDIWWDLREDRTFESYSIDVEIRHDVPESVNLYIAPIGIAHLNKTPFYGGLQTQVDGNTKSDRRLRKIGRGTLMSMWGERSLDAIRPSIGGFRQSSGHEGDFVSVRRPYAWTKGKYTYKVVRMDEEVVGENTYTWVGAFVYAHAKDENIFIGALRFPGDNLVLSRRMASFVEIYGRAIPVDQIPRVDVVFNNLHVNGQPIGSASSTAIYPKGVPDYANVIKAKDGLLVEVGKFVADRKQRQVELNAD